MTIGVDGCKSGWVAAVNHPQDTQLELFTSLDTLWDQYGADCEWLLIDMPIGLVDNGPEGRACDQLARKMLSPRRHSSIFTPPCRAALYASEEQASMINFTHTGKKLSRQTINIMPKMREVDRWLCNLPLTDRQKVRESHPEVVFTALHGGVPLFHNKKTRDGQLERLAILQKFRPDLLELLAQSKIPRRQAVADDLIDALVLGVAAEIAVGNPDTRCTLPNSPPIDGKGLPMEIFYVIP